MSSFLSRLIGQKTKKTKENHVEITKSNCISNSSDDISDGEETENAPVISRRLSLSKSGRMKEKRRNRTTSINCQSSPTSKKEKELDLPDKEVFDFEGIVKISDQDSQK